MDKVIFYLKNYAQLMLPYLAIFVPLYLLARGCWLVRRNQPMNFQRELCLGLLALYTLFVLAITVLPEISLNGGLVFSYPEGSFGPHNAGFQLVPGNFLNYLGFSLRYLGGGALVALIGNLCLFLPMGFLAQRCFGGRWWQYLLAGAGISLGIELFQLLLPRATDVDDLILNTLGMLGGYFLGNGYGSLVRRKREKEQGSSHGKVKGEE